ncbi:MAG TPA: NADPH:quinone oxidoreductase family protein [Polyangiaceae bacterium]|jgi:NADPH2:quinone reductase
MKALVCRAYGPIDTLVVGELPDPTPAAGQVVVGVRACGVNFPDLLVVQGKYQFKPPPPFSPGGEVAGVVEAVGAGVDGLRPGDRVLAMSIWGGIAEKLAADASQVVRLPDGVDFVSASCIATAYGTTVHALRDRASLRPGETLLVLGAAGGVGLAAVQVGKRMGARVIAAASTAEKLETCRRHGADLLVNYATEDLKERVKALTDGAGADVVYDPVGGPHTEAALRATAWNGRVLVIGFTAGDIPRVPTNLVLLKGCSLVGVFWGMALMRERTRLMGQIEEILGWVKDGSLQPHVHATFPLSRALEALREVEQRRVQGKVVVLPGES